MSIQFINGYFFIYKGKEAGSIQQSEITPDMKVPAIVGGIEEMGYSIEVDSTLEGITQKRESIINGNNPTPSFIIDQEISNMIIEGVEYTRKAVVTKICTIDYINNVLPLELKITHYNGVYAPDLDRKILLIANNSTLINGVGDFDYLIDLHENKGIKISEIAKQMILLRDSEGIINEKCNYDN